MQAGGEALKVIKKHIIFDAFASDTDWGILH